MQVQLLTYLAVLEGFPYFNLSTTQSPSILRPFNSLTNELSGINDAQRDISGAVDASLENLHLHLSDPSQTNMSQSSLMRVPKPLEFVAKTFPSSDRRRMTSSYSMKMGRHRPYALSRSHLANPTQGSLQLRFDSCTAPSRLAVRLRSSLKSILRTHPSNGVDDDSAERLCCLCDLTPLQ